MNSSFILEHCMQASEDIERWQGSVFWGDFDKMSTSKMHANKVSVSASAVGATTAKAHLCPTNSKVNMLSTECSYTSCEAAPDMTQEEGRCFTVEEIVDLGDDSLGLKVLLTAREGSYLGVINYVLKPSKRLALEKVSNPNTGKKRVGLLTFFFHNILNIKVVGEDQEARQRLLKDVYCEKHQGKKLLRKKVVCTDPQVSSEEDSPDEEDSSLSPTSQKTPTDKQAPSLIPPSRIPRPSKWIIIDAIDDAYKKALSIICKETVISVSAAGLELGRSGTLVWLSVATSTMIFLFDAAKMGPSEAMGGGLGDILQDGQVVKVVHDCRAIEDLFHHQMNINLNNVFDTQATEVYLHMLNHQGEIPRLVSSLPLLVAHHLGVVPYSLFPQLHKFSEDDDSVWLERPLSNHLCEHLAREVMYLREVRLEQLDLMLVDLRQMTALYLGALRDKDSLTVRSLERQVVPAEVQKLGQHSSGRGGFGSHTLPGGFTSRHPPRLASRRRQ